jgi:hypothetical protein
VFLAETDPFSGDRAERPASAAHHGHYQLIREADVHILHFM